MEHKPKLGKVAAYAVAIATILLCTGAVTLINLATQVMGLLAVGNGGTGVNTLAAHGLVVGNGSSAVNVTSAGTSGQCFISNGASSDPTPQTCPGGSGIIGSTVSAVTVTSSTSAFAPFSGGGLSSTTETNVDQNAPDAATVSNLYVQVSLAPGTGNTFVFTLRDAAASKAVTCTISNTATSCNDLTHTFTPAAGDLLDWQISATGTIIVTPNVLISAQWGGSIATGVVSNCSTANSIAHYGSTGTTVTCIDFPHVITIPAANCNNTTAGAGWSLPSGGSVACRAGTNNLGGSVAITDTSSTFAQFSVAIPEDWDTVTLPYIRFGLASTDATNAHTIIPQIKVSCEKGDGSTTDDVSFNAAHSLSTTTLNGNANRFWSTSNVQMNSTDMTGCVAGAMMIVQVGRATDTGTQASFYYATITWPRLVVVQAN